MDEGYRTLYQDGSDRIPPFTVLMGMHMGMHNAAASWVGTEHGLRGPQLTFSTACSSATVAIGEAWRRVASGELTGAQSVAPRRRCRAARSRRGRRLHTLAGVDADDPSASCKPFSNDRTGMVLGEGAAILALEWRERAVAQGADILGEVIGYAATDEAGHVTRPSVTGPTAAMRAAPRLGRHSPLGSMRSTRTAPVRGPTTPPRRPPSARCSARTPDAVPVSVSKSMHAHLLGAAGATEAALAPLAMRERVVLPTFAPAPPRPAMRSGLRAERGTRGCPPPARCCRARSLSGAATRCRYCAGG